MPIDRAVPAMIFSAWSRSLALRSAILVVAISRTWSRVTVATFVLCGSPDPLSTPAALSSMRAAGGVLVMKVNERSSKTEISTGMTLPRCDSVAPLYALQNSMMLTPCWPSAGPTGGAGVAAPALIWSLMTAVNRFLGGMTSFFVTGWNGSVAGSRREFTSGGGRRGPSSDLGDLVERQLDRRLAAEDRDQDLQLLLLGVDLVDRGGQRGERGVHDRHRLADLEVDDGGGRSRRGGGLAATGPGCLRRGRRREDLHDLVQRQRRGPRGGADETRDTGGVADRTPRLVVEFHADQQVARQHLAVDLRTLAVLDLGDLLGGHLDLIDVVLDVQRLDACLEVGLHLVLVAGVGVHDVPVAGSPPQRLAKRLDRVVVLLHGGRVDVRARGRVGPRGGRQAVRVAALHLGGCVGDLFVRDQGACCEVGGVAGALGGTGLAGAGLDVCGAAHVESRVVQVAARNGAVGLEGLAGVGHWFSSLIRWRAGGRRSA